MRFIQAREYGWLEYADSDDIRTCLERAAKESKEEQWETLGLHLDGDGKAKAHWFVGQVWLDREKKVVLRVLPKIETSVFSMYLRCLTDAHVSGNLDETLRFWEDQPHIPLSDEAFPQREILPLLIARFLFLLSCLCQRHLGLDFETIQANLQGKVVGRPIIVTQVRQNLAQGRLDRVVCRFQRPSIDNLLNQVLRAALEQSLKSLRQFRCDKEILWRWASICSAALSQVSLRRIKPMDFEGIRLGGFLKPYREPLRLARLILNLLGYDPLEELPNNPAPALPPFAIDMNELFERYCEALLRKRYHKMRAMGKGGNLGHNGGVLVRPDFLIWDDGIGWIVDAKYKPGWSPKEQREDVFQLMAYSRHNAVLQTLGNLGKTGKVADPSGLRVAVLYPDEGGEESNEIELGSAEGKLEDFQVPLAWHPVVLPRASTFR